MTAAEFDSPPKSGYDNSASMIAGIDAWIESLHPTFCEKRLQELLQEKSHQYVTAVERLMAHCLDVHDSGILTIADMCTHHTPWNARETGLSVAILRNQDRLLRQLCEPNNQVVQNKGGLSCVGLVSESIDDAHFDLLWSRFCTGGSAEQPRDLLRVLFRVAAFSPTRVGRALALIRTQLPRLSSQIPEDLVFALVHSPQLTGSRDEILGALIDSQGVGAARLILLECDSVSEPPRCIREATSLVIESFPHDAAVAVGVAWCLNVDPDFAVPIIVHWVDEACSAHLQNQFLRLKIEQSDQERLFLALATDAVERNSVSQYTLAMMHHDLISKCRPVLSWLKSHIEDQRSTMYSATLLVWYLSVQTRDTSVHEEKELVSLANTLHRKFGHLSEDEIRREYNLTDNTLTNQDVRLAIALAKDVCKNLPSLDEQDFLNCVKKYPATYAALGGPQLDRSVARGDYPWCAWAYSNCSDSDTDSGPLLGQKRRFRESWEGRFEKIISSGVTAKSQKLRENRFVWAEMRILACLVDHFTVRYEPSGLKGFDERQPEFLLESPDGSLILEVASIGSKPEDVEEGVKGAPGNLTKKTLLNKWHGQFNECKTDFRLPVVIAVQLRWHDDFEFDLVGSLYGPEKWVFVMDPVLGKATPKGSTRDSSLGFFGIEGTDCISAVAGIKNEDSSEGYLTGELLRPTKEPRHPLNSNLWVKLRDSLFGPSPSYLVERMLSIPSMTKEEATILIENGVDEISFFANDKIPYRDEMPISLDRFRELQLAAMRLTLK